MSPSAPSIPSTPESSISNTTNSRNVTPTTSSKRPRSYVSETSSSSILHRPPITEIPITTRTQQTPINTPIVHIPKYQTLKLLNNTSITNILQLLKLLDFNLNLNLYTFLTLNIHDYLH